MQDKRFRVAVVGAGYVGLTTGVCMAELGHRVSVFDIDADRIDSLSSGRVPFYEEGLDRLLKRHLDDGALTFSTELDKSITGAQFVYLCVPTPSAADGSVDIGALCAAAESIGPHLDPDAIVINKSTVPVGAAAVVLDRLQRNDVAVASNPEFLREGTALADFMHPDRIIIGADTAELQQRVAELYRSLDAELVLTDPTTAELIKYVCNAYLATRLSFVNSVSELCESLGGQLSDVTRAMGLDRRIGPHFLRPGPGWGGSCFPKDATALTNMAGAAGYDFHLLREVIESNERQLDRVAERALTMLAQTQGTRVAVWGLAFKAGTDDTRSSPAIEVIQRLIASDVTIVGYDPHAHYTAEGVERAESEVAAAEDADLLLVLTEWPDFAKVNPARVAVAMRAPYVFDTRGVLDLTAWEAAGFTCEAIGRPRPTRSLP